MVTVIYCMLKCKISAFFIPSSFFGYSQIMPLAIMVLFVRFPHHIVETDNHIAIIQCKINPISLKNIEKQMTSFKSEQDTPVVSHKSDLTNPCYNTDFKISGRTDQAFVCCL